MSYEGSVEYLCVEGHRSLASCYEDDVAVCRCGAAMAYRHDIDHTNGDIEDDPSTVAAPVEEIGFDDLWREDHHGNRYAIKMPKYRPLEHWRQIRTDAAVQSSTGDVK